MMRQYACHNSDSIFLISTIQNDPKFKEMKYTVTSFGKYLRNKFNNFDNICSKIIFLIFCNIRREEGSFEYWMDQNSHHIKSFMHPIYSTYFSYGAPIAFTHNSKILLPLIIKKSDMKAVTI